MLDIIIPLGTGSTWNNNELKYCLRSVEKHAVNLRNVIIVGGKLNSITPNIHYLVTDIGNHEVNIWWKIYIACIVSTTSENFLLLNDDYIFLKSFDVVNYPFVYNGDIINKGWRAFPDNNYQIVSKDTHNLLVEEGKGTLFYDIHRPIIINKTKFIETYNCFVNVIKKRMGILVKSTYCNWNDIKPDMMMPDNLITAPFNNVVKELITDCDMFSYKDRVINDEFKQYLEELFPNKCRYEL